jgi:hypothetical protein
MALITFRCRAAGELFMFAETARRIFEIIGKNDAARGVLTADELPAALERLTAAVDEEKARLRAADEQRQAEARAGHPPEPATDSAARAITLGQRAFPLIEMLRAAQRKGVEVTWGV